MSNRSAAASRRQELHREALERIVQRTETAVRIANDPVGVVRDYPPEEREVVAHVAAVLAYGAVSSIRRAIRQVLEVLGDSPASWVRACRRGDFLRARPDFVYRMTRADDVDALLCALGALMRQYGSLESAFLARWSPEDEDLVPALTAYVALLRGHGESEARGFRYLTPSPAQGGATKRWHLMLRWLVRPDDGVDLGCWRTPSPHQLLLPIDRHIEGIVRNLGWVRRATPDLRFTREATARLRDMDATDPLRYDFALCHMGIAKQCRHRWDEPICSACPLEPFCVAAAAR